MRLGVRRTLAARVAGGWTDLPGHIVSGGPAACVAPAGSRSDKKPRHPRPWVSRHGNPKRRH